jgi:[CysO sulfur-carrier protein]-S-L-cysteine hydrolase
MAGEIHVRAGILEEMLRHARAEPRVECCGLLAGVDGVISKIFPAKNALASPTAYEIAPQELFQLFRSIREEGLEHLGIYHSHPAGENVPSRSDIEQSYYPLQAYFILDPQHQAPHPIRAFQIYDGRAQKLKIVVVET